MPRLHRAFDLGWITIDEHYCVVVSTLVNEGADSPAPIRKYKGKKILLPENPKYWPGQEYLDWHRQNIFKDG